MPGAILLVEDLDSVALGSGVLRCVPYIMESMESPCRLHEDSMRTFRRLQGLHRNPWGTLKYSKHVKMRSLLENLATIPIVHQPLITSFRHLKPMGQSLPLQTLFIYTAFSLYTLEFRTKFIFASTQSTTTFMVIFTSTTSACSYHSNYLTSHSISPTKPKVTKNNSGYT